MHLGLEGGMVNEPHQISVPSLQNTHWSLDQADDITNCHHLSIYQISASHHIWILGLGAGLELHLLVWIYETMTLHQLT